MTDAALNQAREPKKLKWTLTRSTYLCNWVSSKAEQQREKNLTEASQLVGYAPDSIMREWPAGRA